MNVRILYLSLLFLSSCSGTNKVCDKDGICMETWQYVSSTTTVTISQLRTAKGNPVAGATVMSTGGGRISYIDPFASGVTTTANEVRAIGDLTK